MRGTIPGRAPGRPHLRLRGHLHSREQSGAGVDRGASRIARAARGIGVDPLEFRRRNILQDEELPYKAASGANLHHITPAETLERATAAIGYEEFRRRQAEWKLTTAGLNSSSASAASALNGARPGPAGIDAGSTPYSR